MSQTLIIADWVSALRWADLPSDVISQAKRCLLDFLGCALGGAMSIPGQVAQSAASNWGGLNEATIIGTSTTVAARHAAFANATMANALDYDDTLHGHPGATTFPAALAAAEKWRGRGREFLLSVIAGYEVAERALALMEPIIPRFKATLDFGTLQGLGAVVAVARLARLSTRDIANALGLASGTMPVPLPRKERYRGEGRSMLKSAYGWAADSALVAVEMTILGFSGPGHALDGNMGFWQVRPSLSMGVSSFADRLGEVWAIRNIEFKPFMACREIHPVLECITDLMRRQGVTADTIKHVDIRSFSFLADEHHYIPVPVSSTDAQFSVPYTVAALLSGGDLTPQSYAEVTLHDPRILDLAQRVRVTVDPKFEEKYPARLGAQVSVTLVNGQTRQAKIEHPKGSPDRPLTDMELREKFHALADRLLGNARATAVATMVDSMDEQDTVDNLTRELRSA